MSSVRIIAFALLKVNEHKPFNTHEIIHRAKSRRTRFELTSPVLEIMISCKFFLALTTSVFD